MSRSRKKNKIHGNTTAKSEKENKQGANRKLRRTTKQKVNSGKTILPKLSERFQIFGVLTKTEKHTIQKCLKKSYENKKNLFFLY